MAVAVTPIRITTRPNAHTIVQHPAMVTSMVLRQAEPAARPLPWFLLGALGGLAVGGAVVMLWQEGR